MGLMGRIFLPASLGPLTQQAVLLTTIPNNLGSLANNRATSRSNLDSPHNRAVIHSSSDSPYSSRPGLGSRRPSRSQPKPTPRSTILRRDRQCMLQRVLIAVGP